MPMFFVFAACAFASGFALRLVDPIVLPVAAHFGVSLGAAAMLNTAFALPYALAQPFLGPLGDRFGKLRCMQVCIAGLTVMLALGAVASNYTLLLATRICAGIFAGGVIPIVLASLGDRYAMSERQVMIGRMLFAIISGQMLGSVVSGLANTVFGWRSALFIATGVGATAAAIAWFFLPHQDAGEAPRSTASFGAIYRGIFENPKVPWLIGCVMAEGVLFYGLFPYMSELLLSAQAAERATISAHTGLVLGAFGIGGIAYAATVRILLGALGTRRMSLIGSTVAGLCYAALVIAPVWWVDAMAMFCAGLAFYMMHNSLQTEATEISPATRGSAVALFSAGFFTGQGIGPLVFGGLLHGLGPAPALLVVALAVLGLGRIVVARVVDGRVFERPSADRSSAA